MMRSTPLRVLMSSCMATSSGVPVLKYAAYIHVNAFGVFADHDEVNVRGLDSFNGQSARVQQPYRANVGVEVHLEAHAEQDFLSMDVSGTRGSPKAPTRMASNSRSSIGKPSGGTVTPSAR